MKCAVVYNPHSGSALSLLELKSHFKNAGIEITRSIAIGSDIDRKLRTPIKNGEIVAAIGGDGTISTVAGLLAGTKAVLLPLPGGTLNHFTRDLGVAQDLDKALAAAKKAKSRVIDIASVNGQYFINNSSLGLYPDSLQTRGRLETKFGKWPSALIGSLRALITFHHYHLTIDDRPITTPFVFIGNNNYKLNDFAATDRSRLDGGVLYVATVHAKNRWVLMKLFWHVITGRLHAADDFNTFTWMHDITIETRRRHLHVSRDGELERLASPLVYKIHPGKLRVIAPR